MSAPLRALRLAAVFAAVLLAAACAGRGRAPAASPLVGRVWLVPEARFVGEDAFFDRLARARFVLLGETHDDPLHHVLQARTLGALVARGRHPAVAFEMISVDRAAALAAATAEPGASAEDVRRAVDWDASGWPDFALYAPIFDTALAAGLPLVAADLGAETRNALRRGGVAALEPAQRAALGLDEPLPASQREAMAAEIVEAHCGYDPGPFLPRMVDVQRARDAQLALALVRAGDRDGAVLIAGAGHVRRDRGVPSFLARELPGASVASVAFVEVEPSEVDAVAALRERWGEPVPFDAVWFTPPVAREDPCEKHRKALEALGQQK